MRSIMVESASTILTAFPPIKPEGVRLRRPVPVPQDPRSVPLPSLDFLHPPFSTGNTTHTSLALTLSHLGTGSQTVTIAGRALPHNPTRCSRHSCLHKKHRLAMPPSTLTRPSVANGYQHLGGRPPSAARALAPLLLFLFPFKTRSPSCTHMEPLLAELMRPEKHARLEPLWHESKIHLWTEGTNPDSS